MAEQCIVSGAAREVLADLIAAADERFSPDDPYRRIVSQAREVLRNGGEPRKVDLRLILSGNDARQFRAAASALGLSQVAFMRQAVLLHVRAAKQARETGHLVLPHGRPQ